MELFEQIGKKVTDAGQGAAQQAKIVADIAKLTGMISERKKRVAQLYVEVGKLYYERHKDDPEAEEPDRIREITTLTEEIAKARKTVKQLQSAIGNSNSGGDKRSPENRKKAPLPRNRRTFIAAVAAVLAILLLGMAFFGGRSDKRTVKKFINATFEADGEAMIALMPAKVVKGVCEEDDVTKKELTEILSASLSKTLDTYDSYYDKWDYSYEITGTKDYSEEKMESVVENYEDGYGVKPKAGKRVSVTVTITSGKSESTASVDLRLIKIGNSWYVDVLGMGGLI